MKYYMFNGLSDNNKKNKAKKELNKSKIWKIVIIIICAVLISALAFFYITNENCREVLDKYVFRKEVNEENLPTIDIDSSKNIKAFAYSKYIALLEQNVLKLYNRSGNEEHKLDIEISNPLFETNGDYLCVAEKNGKKIYLISNKNIVWQKDIEGNINSINVNKNGYVSVIISGTSYKTVIQTYDSNGNELFKTYLSTTNVIDADISNDNKYLAIAEANFSGIVVQSSIKTISIEDAKKKSSESIKYTHLAEQNDLIINIKYQNKNELVCMYDNHIDILNEEKNTELVNFKNEEVLFADINLSNKIIKVIQKSDNLLGSDIEMQIINNNTQNSITYKIENTPRQIFVQDDMIAVNLGTTVLFINDNGWLVKKYKSRLEIQNIIFCDEIAGVVSKNKIKIISL